MDTRADVSEGRLCDEGLKPKPPQLPPPGRALEGDGGQASKDASPAGSSPTGSGLPPRNYAPNARTAPLLLVP